MQALPLSDIESRCPSFDVCFWTKYYRSLDVVFKVRCFERVFMKSERERGRGRATERERGGWGSDLATMYFTSLNVFQRDTGAACGKVFLLVESLKKKSQEALKSCSDGFRPSRCRTATQTCTTSPYKDHMCAV